MGENKQNLNIGWIGFHKEGLPALKALLASRVKLAAVISLTSEGLAKRSGAADYKTVCRDFDVPLYEVSSINDPASIEILNSLGLDVCFVIGWSQLLSPQALAAAKIGMIGAHASLLPHGKGSAPINWSLIKGGSETGNSLIWLEKDVDSGRIIDQTVIPITIYDTCDTLYDKVAESNAAMILRCVNKLNCGQIPGIPQQKCNETILPRRRPQDGLINWKLDSLAVYNFIRALTKPYPGAFSYLNGKYHKVWQCALLPQSLYAGKAGEVLGAVYSPEASACGQVVACGRGAVVLLEVENLTGTIRGTTLSSEQWEGKIWADE